MALLVGRHINRIDRKGRVSVPKPFREAFARDLTPREPQAFTGIYAFPSFKGPAIEGCSEADMARIADSIDNQDLFSDDGDDLNVIVLESAHPLPFDPEGRIVLPADLIEHAALDAEALFVGRGRRLQIWNPGAYDLRRQEAFSRARERGATLPLGSGSSER